MVVWRRPAFLMEEDPRCPPSYISARSGQPGKTTDLLFTRNVLSHEGIRHFEGRTCSDDGANDHESVTLITRPQRAHKYLNDT